MIGNPGEDQSASTRADTRNPSWQEGRDAAGAGARGGRPGSPPYDRAFGTPHGVSAGAARARADRGSGPLRVTTIASFLAQWLLPRLPNFTSQHAGIDVQIHTSTELVDFVKTGMDAGIRFGAGTWARLHAQKLVDEWLVPVCTPQLLQRHGLVTEARDLRHYKLLHSTYEPWTAWLLEGGPDEVWPSSGAAFDDAIAIVRAAEAGHGLALSRWSLVADPVALGRLAV